VEQAIESKHFCFLPLCCLTYDVEDKILLHIFRMTICLKLNIEPFMCFAWNTGKKEKQICSFLSNQQFVIKAMDDVEHLPKNATLPCI
jgi:hypothetical protein